MWHGGKCGAERTARQDGVAHFASSSLHSAFEEKLEGHDCKFHVALLCCLAVLSLVATMCFLCQRLQPS